MNVAASLCAAHSDSVFWGGSSVFVFARSAEDHTRVQHPEHRPGAQEAETLNSAN